MNIIAFVHYSYKKLVRKGCWAFKPLEPDGTVPAIGDLEVVAKPSLMWIIRICYPAFFIDLEGNNILEMRTERMSLRIASYTIYFIPIAKRAVFLFKHTHEHNITWIDPIIAKRHGVLGNHSQKRNAWNIGRYPRLRFQRGGNHLFWKCECIPNIPCIGYDIGTIYLHRGMPNLFLVLLLLWITACQEFC